MPTKYTDQEVIEALESSSSQAEAARKLGIAKRSIERRLASLRRKGYSPQHDMTHVVPDGYRLKGTSTLYGEDGALKMQWVKTTKDDERQAEMIEAAVNAMAEDLPRYAPIEKPVSNNDRLCNLYTLTDAHIGALSWHKENLEGDWDLSIQENVLVNCFQMMMSQAPNASHCVINQLGDFLHFDGMDAVTPTSGHLLDADGRFGKVVETAIRVLRRVVDMALHKHETVSLVVAEGNHDMASSVWIRKMFAAVYENESRLSVNDSEMPYYIHQHGKVMLGFHHGHIKKNEQLPMLFAAQFPRQWGESTKRYCHTGHRHHYEHSAKDNNGMTVTQHPTLAARDSHASRGGWISSRQALAMTYHNEYGFVGSNVVTPEMLVS